MQFKTKLGLVDIPNDEVMAASRDIAGSAASTPEPAAPSGAFSVAGGSSPVSNRNLWLSLQQLANDEAEKAKRTSDPYRKGWHDGMACAFRNASVLYDSHRQWEAATVRQPDSNVPGQPRSP